jgi:hypothetical protein
LIADRNPASRSDEFGDVTLGGVVGHAAHRDCVTFGQGKIKQAGSDFRILEKEFVKIAEPKKEKSISGHARPEPLILAHHWGEGINHGRKHQIDRFELPVYLPAFTNLSAR